MTEKSGPSNTLIIAIMGVGTLLGLVLLGLTAFFIFRGTGDRVANNPEAEMADTPQGNVIIIPTATFPPTVTFTPTATETPLPTATSTPTPTNTPRPTSIPPTAVPPTSTNTPLPPAGAGHSLINISFSVESTSVPAGGKLWFNFNVDDNTNEENFFGRLGVVALRPDGTQEKFQTSWSNSYIDDVPPWRDHIDIQKPGTYNLYLAICYSSADVCLSGGDWEYLAGPIQVTIT